MSRRADALFELTDAILAAGTVPAPVRLSLQPVHRRAWTSLYAALRHGRVDEDATRDLLARQQLLEADDGKGTRVYAVDRSVWPRCDAEASPERGYYHHPSRHSAGQPIVAGWSYQLVAQLGFCRDSWISPVDAKRVRPEEDANDIAAGQVEALVCRLPEQPSAPLFVFDAGYDPVRLQRRLGDCSAQILVRFHSGRVLRLPRGERRRRPKKLWLWWDGEGKPDLELLWKSYVRRFDIEHAVKLLKGSLGWTTRRVRHPEQADRWTWLVIAAYTQLRLARGIVADRKLPWEKPLSPHSLTPNKVLRNFATLLPAMGTPAEAPKPRGRSPGRPKGSRSGPARRYPAVKKAA